MGVALYITDILHHKVYTSGNTLLGKVKDILVSSDMTFPEVSALQIVAAHTGRIVYHAPVHIQFLSPECIIVQQPDAPFSETQPCLHLARDVLDRQVIDVEGARVVKVNDVQLMYEQHLFRVVGVDVSWRGILRRLGLRLPLPAQSGMRMLPWNMLELVNMFAPSTETGEQTAVPQIRLHTTRSRLEYLHPADIADILEQLPLQEAKDVLERLDTDIAVETIQELEMPLQSDIVRVMEPEEASDMLEQLAPDDAADILATFPEANAAELLNMMEIEDAQPLRQLLTYDADTAGGLMTNDVLMVTALTTRAEVIALVQEYQENTALTSVLYLIDDATHLIGVIPLVRFLVGSSESSMEELALREPITVSPDAKLENVAALFTKYNLINVPVVDGQERLLGCITVDDVLNACTK